MSRKLSYNQRRYLSMVCSASLLFGLLCSGGCESLMEAEQRSEEQKNREPDDKFDFIRRNEERKFTEAAEKLPDAVGEKQVNPTDAEFDKMAAAVSRDGAKPSPERSPGRPATPPPYYEDLMTLDADEMLDVVLVFNSSPLVDTLPAFADILGFNFTADSDLKSTVTLNLNSRMTRRELWEAFDQTLQLAGAGAIRNGQLLEIMPAAKLPGRSALRNRNRLTSGAEVISYSLFNVTAKDAVAQLKPFLSPAGVAVEAARSNVIVLCDRLENIPKLKEVLELLDQPGRQNWPRAVVHCRNVKPSAIAQELSEVLPVLGFPVVLATDKTEVPGAVQLTGVDRIQILAVTAATEEAIKEVRNWISILDNADSSTQERMYVYKVTHDKAEYLAQALSVIFSTQGTSLTVDTSFNRSNSTSEQTRTSQITTQQTRNQNTNTNSQKRYSTNNQSNTELDLVSNVFNTPVRLFADGVQNRLVIRTTPRTYAMIKALLDRLDVVPAQVLFQILIVEITLTDSNEFGLQFNNVSYGGGTGVSTGTNFNDIGMNDSTSEGFKLGIFDKDNPEENFGYLRALAGRDNIKVISSPQLLVTSNTTAKIQVGQDVPILTQDLTTSDSATGNVTRSYTYEETGIILSLIPQVTSTDLISMQIEQKVSEAIKNTITSATDTPVISTRVLNTAMTIANGKTMVIGGMIQEKNNDRLQSVPIIADIPFLRRFFGNTNQSVERTELLVLVTGYIVNGKSPVEEMIRRYNSSVKALSLFESDMEKKDKEDAERLKVKVEAVPKQPGVTDPKTELN